MNPGAYQCWDKVSFIKELCLIPKESKKGVTILLYIKKPTKNGKYMFLRGSDGVLVLLLNAYRHPKAGPIQ